MSKKRIVVLLVALIFALSVVSLALAEETIKGKLIKMVEKKLTIELKDKKEVNVEVKSIQGTIKVGDDVIVRDGVAKKLKVITGC